MRRIVTVVIATIGGLALIASFHSASGTGSRSVIVASPTTQPPAGGSPPPGGTSSPSSPSSTSTPSSGGGGSQTIDGPVESNRYGDVQVEIVLSGGQISDVEALQLPSDRRRSQEINSIAGPDLRQEALQAQSASIDIISGATYTSQSYIQSLQAALDQAGR